MKNRSPDFISPGTASTSASLTLTFIDSRIPTMVSRFAGEGEMTRHGWGMS